MQKWISVEIYPKGIKNGLRKLGVVIPKEFFARLGAEQVVDELVFKNQELDLVCDVKYFDKVDAATEWLNK